MKHRFNIPNLLLSYIGHKGLIYPGLFVNKLDKTGKIYTGEDFNDIPDAPDARMNLASGTPLYKEDERLLGNYYFMPVILGDVEIPAAVISMTGKKSIVKTALTEHRGTVKELISVDDYDISIIGTLYNSDHRYPEEEIAQVRDLYSRNESVKLISALSDLLLEQDDMVVIESIKFPETAGNEEMQVVELTCVSDAPFELEIV